MDDSRLKYLQSIKQELEDIAQRADRAGKELDDLAAADEAKVAKGSDPLRNSSRRQVEQLLADAEAKRAAVPPAVAPKVNKEGRVVDQTATPRRYNAMREADQAERAAIAAFNRYKIYSQEYNRLQSIARAEEAKQRAKAEKERVEAEEARARAERPKRIAAVATQVIAAKPPTAPAASKNEVVDVAVAKANAIVERRLADNMRRRYGSSANERAAFAASLAASRRVNNIIYQGNVPIASQREKMVIQQAINTTTVEERRAAAIKSREASYVTPVPTTVSGRNISRRRAANPTRSFTLPEEVAAEIELDISERERQLEIAENRFQRRKYGGPRSERKRKGRFKKTYIENIEQKSEEQYLRYLQAPEGSAEEADARLEHERLYDLAKNLRLGRASINALPTTRGNAYGPTGRYRYNQARPTTRSRPAAVIAPDLQEQLSYVTALAKAITQVSERAEYAASSSEQVSQIEKAKSDALHFLENAASVAANPNVDAKTVGQIVRRFRGHAKAFSANPQFRELHRNFASNITQSGLNPESFEAFVLGLVMDTLDQAKEPKPAAKPARVPNRARVRVIKGNAELPQVDSVEVFGTDEEAVTGFSTDSGQQQARRRYALVAPFKEQQQREAIVKSMNNTMMVATDQSSGMTTGQVTYESFSSMGNLFQDGRDFVVQQLMQQIVDSVQADITSGRFADLNGKRVPATLAKNATAAVRAVSQMSTMRTFEGRITPYDTDMPLGVKKSPDALKTISQGLAGAMLAHYAEGGEFRDASDIQSFVDKYTSELFDESKTPSVYTAEKLVMSQMDVLRKQRADQASRVARNPSIMQDPEFKKEYLQTKQQLAALETIMQDDSTVQNPDDLRSSRAALLGVSGKLSKEDALKMLAGSALELDPDLMPRPDWATQAVNFFSGVYGRLRKSGFNAPERLFERPTTLRKQVDVATGVEDKTEQLEQEIQREVDAAATAVAVNNKGQLTVGGSPLAEASRTVPEAFAESIGISSQVATGTGIGSFAKGLLETARRFKKISKNRENKNNKLLEYNNKLLSLQEKLQTADQQEKPVIRQEIARINAELSKLENDSTDSIFGVEGASATQTRDILTASDDMAAAVDRGIPLLDAVMADPTKNFSYKKFTQMFPQLQDFVPDHDTFIKLRKLARQRGKSSPAEIYSQLFDIMRAPVTGRVDSLINNLAAARGEDPRAIRSMYVSGGLQAVPDEYKQLFQTTEMFATPVEAFTELQNAAAAKGAPGTVVQMAAAGQLGSEAKNAIEDFERPVTLNSLINSAKYFTRNMITGMQKRVSKAMKGYNINHFDPQQMKEFEALLPTTVSEDRDRPIDPLTHIRAKFVNDRGESLYGEDFTMAVESEIEKARQSLYSSNLTEVEQQGVRSRINNLQKLLDAETPEVQDDSENVQIARNTSRIGRRTLTGVFKSGSSLIKYIKSRFARAAQARAQEEAAREAATPRLFNANQVRNLLSEFTLTPSKNQSFIENKGMRLIGQALLKVPLDDLATGESILSALSDVGFTDVGRLSTVENFLNPDSRAFVLNTMNDPKRRAAMERLFDVMGQAQKNLGIDRLTLPNVAVSPETEALFSGTVTPERLEEIYANRKSDAPFASVLPFVSTASLRNPTASSLNDRQVAGMYRLMSVANDLFSIKDALDPDSSLNKAQRQQILREKAAGRYYQGMDTSSDEFKAKFEDDFKKITGMLGISEHAELNKRRLQYEVNLKDRGAVGNTLTFGRSYKDILDLARGTNITTAGQFVTEQLADSNLSTTTSAGEYQTLQGRSGLLRRFLNQFRISRLANQSADLRKLYGDDAIIPNTEANLKLAQEIKGLNELDRQAYEERLKQARVERGLPAERVSSAATADRTVQTVDKLTKDLVEANPDLIYLFGDNLQRTGTAGQATIRHASTKNVVGIPTKKKPATTEDAYFTDSDEDFEIFKKGVDEALASIPAGKTVVMPSAGIGTGLAQLPTRAPRLFAYLQQRLKSLGSPAEAKPSTASKIVSTITKPGVMSAILLAGTTAYSMLTGEDPSAMLGGLMAAGVMGAGGVKIPPKLRKIVDKSAKKIRAAKTEEEVALVETATELAEKAAEASAAAPVSVVPPVAPKVSKANRLKALLRAVSDKFRVAPSIARALMDRALASVRPSSIKEAAPIASAVTAPLVDTTTVVEDEATAKERRRIERRRAGAAARLTAGVGDRGVRKRKRPTVVSPATSPEDSTEVPSTTSAEEVTSDDRETRIKNIQAIKAIRVYALKRAELFVKHGLGWDGTPRRVSTYPAEEQKELSILHEDMFKKTEHLDKEKKNAIFKKIFDRETAALLASTTTSTTAAGEPKTSTSTLAKTAVKPMPIGEGPGGGPTPVWIVGQSGALQVTGGGGGGKDSGGTVTTKTKDADGKEVTTTEQAGEFPQVPALVRALLTGLDAYRNTKHMALAKETDPLKIEALQKDITDASRRTLKEVLNKEDMLAATGYAYRDDLDFNTNLENASGSLAERIMANQVLDEDGNPVLDEKGNPVFKPNKAQVTAALTLEKLAQTSRFQTQSMTQRPPTSYAGGGGGVVRDKAGLVYDTSMIRLQAARNAFDQSAGAVIGGTMNEARDFLLRETRAGISGLFGNVPVETITDPLTGATKRIAQLMDPSAIPAVSTLDTAEVRSATEVLNSQFTDFSSNSGASMEELGSDLSNLVQTIDALSRASMEAKRKITEQIQAEQKRLQELKEDPASSAADVADAEDRLKALRQQELDLDTYSQGINATTKGIGMALNQQKQAAGVLDTGSARAIDVFDQQMRAIMTRPGLLAGFGRTRDARRTTAAFARDFVGEEGSRVLMSSRGLVAYNANGRTVDLAYANSEQLRELQKRLAAKNAPVSMEQLIRLQQTSAQLRQVGNQQPFSDKVFYMAAKIRDYQTLLDTGVQYSLGLPRVIAGAVQNAANPALTAARTMVTAQGLARSPEVYSAALGAASTQQSMFGGSLTSNLGQITSFIPLTNAYGVDINQVVNVARKLAAFDPAQGMEGASIAIKEFLSGNVASLSRRFEINRSMLSNINQGDASQMLDSLDEVLSQMGVTDRLIDEQANSLGAKYDKMLGRLESAEIAISAFAVELITPALEFFAGPDSILAKNAKEMSLTTARDERMRFAGDARLINKETGFGSEALDIFAEDYYQKADAVIAEANDEILKEAMRYQSTTGRIATVSPYRRLANMSAEQRMSFRFKALSYMEGGMNQGQAQLQALRDVGGDYATFQESANQRRLVGSTEPLSKTQRDVLARRSREISSMNVTFVPVKVTDIIDADTFKVTGLGVGGIREDKEQSVRIAGIDAPEKIFGEGATAKELAKEIVKVGDTLYLPKKESGFQFDDNSRIVSEAYMRNMQNYGLIALEKGLATTGFMDLSGFSEEQQKIYSAFEASAAELGVGPVNERAFKFGAGANYGISQEAKDKYFRDTYLMGLDMGTILGSQAAAGAGLGIFAAPIGAGLGFGGIAAATAAEIAIGASLGAVALPVLVGASYYAYAKNKDKNDTSAEKLKELNMIEDEIRKNQEFAMQAEAFIQAAAQTSSVPVFLSPENRNKFKTAQSQGTYTEFVPIINFNPNQTVPQQVVAEYSSTPEEIANVMGAADRASFIERYQEQRKVADEALEERYNQASELEKEFYDAIITNPFTGQQSTYFEFRSQLDAFQRMADNGDVGVARRLSDIGEEKLMAPIQGFLDLKDYEDTIKIAKEYGLTYLDYFPDFSGPSYKQASDRAQYFQEPERKAFDINEFANMSTRERMSVMTQLQAQILNPQNFKIQAKEYTNQMLEETMQLRQKRFNTVVEANAMNAIAGLGYGNARLSVEDRALGMLKRQEIGGGVTQDKDAAAELETAQRNAVAKLQELAKAYAEQAQATLANTVMYNSTFANLASSIAMNSSSFNDMLNIMGQGDPFFAQKYFRQMSGVDFMSVLQNGIVNPFSQTGVMGFKDMRSSVYDAGLGFQFTAGRGGAMQFSNAYTQGPRGAIAFAQDAQSNGVFGQIMNPQQYFQSIIAPAINGQTELARRGIQQGNQMRDLQRQQNYTLEDITRNGMRQLEQIHRTYTRNMYQLALNNEITKRMTRANSYQSILAADISEEDRNSLLAFMAQGEQTIRHAEQGDVTNFLKSTDLTGDDINALIAAEQAYQATPFTDPDAKEAAQIARMNAAEPVKQRLQALIDAETDPVKKSEYMSQLALLGKDPARAAALEPIFVNEMQRRLGDATLGRAVEYQREDAAYEASKRPLQRQVLLKNIDDAYKADKKDPVAYALGIAQAEQAYKDFERAGVLAGRALAATERPLAAATAAAPLWEDAFTTALETIGSNSSTTLSGLLNDYDDFGRGIRTEIENAAINFERQKLALVTSFGDAMVELAAQVPPALATATQAFAEFAAADAQASALMYAGDTEGARDLYKSATQNYAMKMFPDDENKRAAFSALMLQNMPKPVNSSNLTGGLSDFAVMTADGPALRVSISEKKVAAPPPPPPTGTGPGNYTGGKPTGTGPFTYNTDEYVVPVKGTRG